MSRPIEDSRLKPQTRRQIFGGKFSFRNICYDNEYDCDATYDPAWTLAVNNINQDGDTATKTYTENDFENWFPSDVFSSGSSKIRKIAICFDDDNGCKHDYRIAWIKGKITL